MHAATQPEKADAAIVQVIHGHCARLERDLMTIKPWRHAVRRLRQDHRLVERASLVQGLLLYLNCPVVQ